MNRLTIITLIVTLLLSVSAQARELSRFESGQLHKMDRLIKNNNQKSALKLINPLLEQKTPHATVFKYSCALLADTDRQSEALACWTRGNTLYPDDISLAINLADSLVKVEKYQAAINALKPFVSSENEPDLLSQARYMLGYSYYQLTQYQLVIDTLLIPQVKQHWWPLICYSQLSLSRWSDARKSAQQWLKSTPDNLAAWQILARSEMGLNNPLFAAVAMDIGQLLDKNQSSVNVSLLGNLKAYNFAVKCVTQLHGDRFTAQHFTCAQYAWLAGQYQQALDFMAQYTIDATTNPSLYDDYYLLQGRLLAALKQQQAAINAWEKVGQQPLALGTGKEIKHARKKRNQQQGQALLLMGQSYWLAQQWREAKACYRKLAQTPGFESIANAFERNLTELEQFTPNAS